MVVLPTSLTYNRSYIKATGFISPVHLWSWHSYLKFFNNSQGLKALKTLLSSIFPTSPSRLQNWKSLEAIILKYPLILRTVCKTNIYITNSNTWKKEWKCVIYRLPSTKRHQAISSGITLPSFLSKTLLIINRKLF